MPNIYVLSAERKPLMPIRKYGRARKLISSGKARIVRRMPFTIQLTYDTPDVVTDECILGIDPGRTNIGLCVVDSKGSVLFASDVETRNKAIAKLMLERKAHRQASRRGERLRRQRRAMATDKSGMAAHTEFWRMLPKYEKPICCKVIRNSVSRFCYRKRPKGWLTPTANQLLQTHLNLIHKLQKMLPISDIVMEINKFDFQRMENPNIKNWEYQKGRLSGFENVFEAISYQQEGKCLLCGKADIEHYHHLIPKSQGGADTLDNLVGLCLHCHGKVHTIFDVKSQLNTKKQGILKKYHALSIINQIIPRLLSELPDILPTYVTTGRETKAIRETMSLSKDHYIDAWCIAVSILGNYEKPEFADGIHNIKQFRRHERANINNQRERTYYLNGKAIAKNRKPRFEQQGPALSDLELTGYELSRLTVKKSQRYYNNKNRLMPGTRFLYGDREYIMSGQLSNGAYLRAIGCDKVNFPAAKCKVLKRNEGLVFVG